MKDGLIRLTGEKDIFYDSVEKVYRYRMHCPGCGKAINNCMCYQNLDRLCRDIIDGIADYTCSAKCALMLGGWDDLDEAMQATGIQDHGINDLTEEQAKKVLKILTEKEDCDCWPGGKDCDWR